MLPSVTVTRYLAIICGCVFWVGTACSNAPSEPECEALLKRTVELELIAAGDDATSPEFSAKAEALVSTARQEFVKQCLAEHSRDRIECGLKADSQQAMRACDAR